MTDYNDGNWHGWNGGECPVHPKSVIQAIRGDSEGATAVAWPADQFKKSNWSDRERSYSIIAFRVIKQHREPREWWISNDTNIAYDSPVAGCVHVREVLE